MLQHCFTYLWHACNCGHRHRPRNLPWEHCSPAFGAHYILAACLSQGALHHCRLLGPLLIWSLVPNYIRPATATALAYMELSVRLLPSTVLHILYTTCTAIPHLYPASASPDYPVRGMSGPTTSIIHSTSNVMAPIASRQFCKLQAGPHHTRAGTRGAHLMQTPGPRCSATTQTKHLLQLL